MQLQLLPYPTRMPVVDGSEMGIGGGSYLNLMLIFGESKAVFFSSLWGTLASIVRCWPIVFRMGVESAARFLLLQQCPVFKHAIGAVDGVLISCSCPTEDEYQHPAQFWTRKGFYAACDCPGSSHDSTMLSMSTLGKTLSRIPEPFYLLGDPAYKVFNSILVLYEG